MIAAMSLTGCAEFRNLVERVARPAFSERVPVVFTEYTPVVLDAPGQPRMLEIAGDYVVYRLSGQTLARPTSLTLRLVSRTQTYETLDFTIDESGGVERFRLGFDAVPGQRRLLREVHRLDGQRMVPVEVASLEERMHQLLPSANENHGVVGSTGVLADVNGWTVGCVRTDYRVRIGAHRGVMTMLAAEGFPFEHVGATIVSDTGRLLYKAEIVDAGNLRVDSPAVAASFDDGYDPLE